MKATRLLSLPPYLFEELENRCREAVAAGRDVIDLSIGDPDLEPPASLKANLRRALDETANDRYPPQRGRAGLKAAIRRYLARRGGVEPSDDDILILCGSKEGLAHLPWAVCNPGDLALLPDPGYPVYFSAARFAGCDIAAFGLNADAGFLPDLGRLGGELLDRAKLCMLNYPNNPTSAVAGDELFRRAIALTDEHDFILANDAAYADVYFDGNPPPLLCAQPGALERPVVEFFSFSKTYCITGWRVGFAVGRPDIIEAMAHLKANIDSGVFGAVQDAVAATLDDDGDEYSEGMRREFQRRLDTSLAMVKNLGFQCHPTCATFYVWVKVPPPWKSMDFALHVLEKADVLVTPGVGFGEGGEGFFRIALTRPIDRLAEAGVRLERIAAGSG